MDLLIRSSALPGSDESRDFVGADHGADLTLILVDARPATGLPCTAIPTRRSSWLWRDGNIFR